jgi:hypothetical protein
MRLARRFAVVSALAGVAVVAGSLGAASAAHRKSALAVRDHSARYLCAHGLTPGSQCGSLFNWPLPANPRVLPGSAAMVARLFSNGSGRVSAVQLNPAPGHDWGDAVFYSRPSDPTYRIHCNKPAPHRCPVEGWRVQIPALARPADNGGDAGMSVISKTSHREFDFWHVQTVPLPRNGGTIVVGWAGYAPLDGWGAGASSSCGTGSCTLMSKGLITYSDLARGRINHALYLEVGCSNGRSVYPAYHGGGGACGDTTNAPAYGQWLQLKMSDSQINRARVPRWLKAIYRAFAHYGAMVNDAGSTGAFDVSIESPDSYTALGLRNPFVGWATWQRRHTRHSHVGAYVADGRNRYWLDFGGDVNWAKKLRVLDPCVIAGTC